MCKQICDKTVELLCGRSSPTTNLDHLTRKLQNIKDKHADQPAKNLATPYRIHVLLLLNRRGWKQLFLKMYICARCFMGCYRVHRVTRVLDLRS